MRLLWLVDALRSAGLTVSPVVGWEGRGRATGFDPRIIVDHHTAGAVGSPHPSLGICINGRRGLPGPLCNVLTDRQGVVHVIASGISNNAGEGSWPRFGATHNRHTIGHEVEHAGVLALERINLDQLEVAARVDAAICRQMQWDETRCVAHREWAPLRKTDPIWSQDDHVGRVGRILRPPRPTFPGAQIMAATVDLAGVVAYVDLCYEAAGRTPGDDAEGRRYWVESAARAADAWPVLDQMWALLAPGK